MERLKDFNLILHKIADMAEVFKSMGEPNRIRIIGFIASGQGQNFSVSDIADWLKISQPAASQHLKNLKNIGLLNPNRNGFHVYYKLDIERFKEIKENFDFLSEIVLGSYKDN